MLTVNVSPSLHTMGHGADPAKKIKEQAGDLSQLELTGVSVLVGTYIRPSVTAGGIHLTDKFLDEDKYQGKVGLVLKVAAGAFIDGAVDKFNGFSVKEGDWVFYRVADGFSLSLNGQICRILEDVHVKGRIPGPDMVL